ncbi:hypothetical protein ACFX11_013702 [Malus domestica]
MAHDNWSGRSFALAQERIQIRAFLNLAIAYLLLCAAAVAYFTTKFVVQWSVRRKFPFNVIWDEDPNFHTKLKSLNEANGSFTYEGEASCSSFLVAENEQSVEFGVGNFAGGKKQSFDLNAKNVAGRRPRLRRGRRGGSVDNGKSSSVLSYDMVQSAAQDIPTSPSSVSKMGNEVSVTEVFVNSDGIEASTDTSSSESVSRVELNEHVDETKPMDGLFVEESGSNAGEKLGFDSNETTTIRVLEQALKEEHAARAALYLELEEERSAAVTAADEAMAMILRLQEEKASIEMEARQYQRMIEEKSAYDVVEMNILKEMSVRREREKHFLEKEIERYWQMVFGDGHVDSTEKPTLELGHS